MTLKEYIVKLQKLEKDYSDCEVIYSCDEEGNRFTPVYHDPSAGQFKADEFTSPSPKTKRNAICIN